MPEEPFDKATFKTLLLLQPRQPRLKYPSSQCNARSFQCCDMMTKEQYSLDRMDTRVEQKAGRFSRAMHTSHVHR